MSNLLSVAISYARATYPKLPYHNFDHATYVCDAIEKILYYEMGVRSEPIPSKTIVEDLKLAAVFHDCVYQLCAEPGINEGVSATVCRKFLSNQQSWLGIVTQERIQRIEELILVTRYPYSLFPAPQNYLECVMRDADLCNIDTDRFLQDNVNIRRELEAGRSLKGLAAYKDEEYYDGMISFLKSLTFHTAYGQKHYPQHVANYIKHYEGLKEKG